MQPVAKPQNTQNIICTIHEHKVDVFFKQMVKAQSNVADGCVERSRKCSTLTLPVIELREFCIVMSRELLTFDLTSPSLTFIGFRFTFARSKKTVAISGPTKNHYITTGGQAGPPKGPPCKEQLMNFSIESTSILRI